MPTIKQLTPSGWSLVNTEPTEDTKVITNPNFGKDPATVEKGVDVKSPTIKVGTGEYFIVIRNDANPTLTRQINLTPPAHPNGTDFVVPVTGQTPKSPVTGAEDPTRVYKGKLSDLVDWTQSGEIKDVPASATGAASPFADWIRVDVNGRQIAAGDTSTRAAKIVDPKDPTHTIDLPDPTKDPQGTLTEVNGTVYLVKPDGSATVATGPDGKPLVKSKDKERTNVAGVGLVEYDPNTDKYTTVIAAPYDPSKEIFQVVNGKTYRWDVATKSFVDSGLPEQTKAAKVYDDPNSEYLIYLDDQGNETNRYKKPNWKPPQPAAVTQPGTDVPNVYSWEPGKGLVATPNANYQTVTQASIDLAEKLGVHVVAGTMSESQAQDLIKQAVALMTAQQAQASSAATVSQAAAANTLTATQNAAQTGAGILQNRVTSAMSGFNQGLQALQNENIMKPLPGIGAKLVGGLSEWVTQLGGGQPVYDAAAAMVNNANPNITGDPNNVKAAYTTLRGLMDLYKQETGKDYVPPEQRKGGYTAQDTTGGGAATPSQTAVQAVQNNSNFNPQLAAANVTNPQTGYNPQASTAALNAVGLRENPQTRAAMLPNTATAGLYNPAFAAAYPSAVGQPATGPVVGALQPLPIPPNPNPYGMYGWRAP